MAGERRTLDLAGAKSKPKTKPEPEENRDDEKEEDEYIISSAGHSNKGRNNIIVAIVAVLVIVVGGFIVLLTGAMKKEEPEPQPTQEEIEMQQQQQQATGSDNIRNNLGIGTQDFTQNTTMTNGDIITSSDEYLTDLNGLTTQVNYTVSEIATIADFVEYKKKRGTWGGGIELHWLDVTYRGVKYVIQIPFKYYKELDDIGIVPVKMEVLKIAGEIAGNDRIIISYMCLDEETLIGILRNQQQGMVTN